MNFPHGSGTVLYPDGNIFEGKFFQSKRHGDGVLYDF
jgi:hypothetical protein